MVENGGGWILIKCMLFSKVLLKFATSSKKQTKFKVQANLTDGLSFKVSGHLSYVERMSMTNAHNMTDSDAELLCAWHGADA